MNIAIDIRSLLTSPRTGIGEYTFELIDAILKQDKEHHFFFYYNSYKNVDAILPEWKNKNVNFVATNLPNKLFDAAVVSCHYPQLDRVIAKKIKKEKKASIPIDCFFSPNLNFTSLTAKTKHLLMIHDLSFAFFPELYTPKQRLWHQLVHPRQQCERATHIIVPSENTRSDIIDYYHINSKKITVIYPGSTRLQNNDKTVPSAFVSKKYNLPPNYILFIGSIEPRKNICALIEAFEKAAPRFGLACNLIIAGAAGWKNSPVYTRAAQSPLRKHIQFIGYVRPEEKFGLIAGAKILAFPSWYEGFGFPPLEAFNAGVPVIISNRSSLPEVAAGSALLVNPHRPGEIANAFMLLLNPNYAKKKINLGLRRAKEFDWQQSAERWLNLVKKICA